MGTLILCVGNERVTDDGIAARIGHVLQSLPMLADIHVDVVPHLCLDLLDRLVDAEHLIIVDGLTADAEPGTSTVVDVTGHSAAVVASGCCHARDVADIIQLARELAPEGTERMITIAGVRVGHLDRYGASFSYAVLSAVPRIVDLLLLTSGAGLKLRLLAAESLRASGRASREPSPFADVVRCTYRGMMSAIEEPHWESFHNTTPRQLGATLVALAGYVKTP